MHSTLSIIGTIATEPKLVHTQSGNQLCSFRVASDERRYDKQQQNWVESGTSWFSVVSFRSLAIHASQALHMGDRVIVTGKLHVKNWEQADRKGTTVEIEADGIGHDLRWGVSRFEKQQIQTETTAEELSHSHKRTEETVKVDEPLSISEPVTEEFLPDSDLTSPFSKNHKAA